MLTFSTEVLDLRERTVAVMPTCDQLHCGHQAQARIPPSQSPDMFTVLPAALSLQHTAVRGMPKSIVAGVPAEFTIHPADHFGNRGAKGECSRLGLLFTRAADCQTGHRTNMTLNMCMRPIIHSRDWQQQDRVRLLSECAIAPAGGRFMAGLISGGQTVAVALQEALDADRVTTGTVVATRAGTWGLGVYLQTSDNRCAASV